MQRVNSAGTISVLVISAWACASKQQPPAAAGPSAAQTSGGDDENRAINASSSLSLDGDLVPIYFDFDSDVLQPEGRERLDRIADVMRGHPDVAMTIEGHCDERGTVEYNMALGDRRARATQAYLKRLGILESRLRAISYGENHPADPGHTEDAWARNRRSQLVPMDEKGNVAKR